MPVDFSLEPEVQEKLDWIREFVANDIEWPREHLPLRRDAARERYAHLLS